MTHGKKSMKESSLDASPSHSLTHRDTHLLQPHPPQTWGPHPRWLSCRYLPTRATVDAACTVPHPCSPRLRPKVRRAILYASSCYSSFTAKRRAIYQRLHLSAYLATTQVLTANPSGHFTSVTKSTDGKPWVNVVPDDVFDGSLSSWRFVNSWRPCSIRNRYRCHFRRSFFVFAKLNWRDYWQFFSRQWYWRHLATTISLGFKFCEIFCFYGSSVSKFFYHIICKTDPKLPEM